ncbi:unnamed protein product [Thlaspi arvense]|uniref:Replication factor A C-terminal domain-containing protein n=1 Tax=Thlaspi arvense TaxID=13288 RepID=A0AAU9RCU5_THLAR|nr:unnamed protein product [Thlaspi arvense]
MNTVLGVWVIVTVPSIMMVNPDLPEIISFREKLPTDGLTLTYTHPNQLTVVNSISVRDDFILHSPRMTINEIISASEVTKCVTMCTIMSIDTEFGWYYMAHKSCAKKVLPHDMEAMKDKYPGRSFKKPLWKCEKCNKDVDDIVPAFMLTFRVMDDSGETKFLLFDKEAMEVVNQTAAQLTQSVDEVQDPSILPLALTNICGKIYLFKISIQSSNIVFNNPSYKVVKIVTQSDIVKKFSEVSANQKTPDAQGIPRSLMWVDEKVPILNIEGVDEDATPTSKRKSTESIEGVDNKDQQSVSKKGCISKKQPHDVKIIKKEKDA